MELTLDNTLKIFFYQRPNKKEPVRDEIMKLPTEERASAFERLDGIQKHGLNYTRVTFKQIKGKLWEIKKVSAIAEVYNVQMDTNTMILLHYLKKKTQKLDPKDRSIAEKRMLEVLKNE